MFIVLFFIVMFIIYKRTRNMYNFFFFFSSIEQIWYCYEIQTGNNIACMIFCFKQIVFLISYKIINWFIISLYILLLD